MAQGSIIWRCRICGNKTRGTCKCSAAKYYIVYPIGSRRKWEVVGKSKKEAERRLAERITQLNNGTYQQPNGIFFRDFIKIWLRDYAKGHTKESTFRSYESMCENKIIPALGDIRLIKIHPGTIQSFISRISNGSKRKTANNFLVLLKTIFKYAEIWGYNRINPTRFIKKEKEDTREMDNLNPEEIQLLLNHSEEPYRTMFLTAIMTGMRRGELFGLQWGDIDWNRNMISVKRGLFWLIHDEKEAKDKARWRFVSPKSKRSIRSIDMSPTLSKALQIHRIKCPVSPFDLVFCNKNGNPIDPDNMVHREFHPTLVRAGLRKIRFHDLRHTYASLLLAQNENLKFIQSQLGHASIQTTIDRYSHLMPNHNVGVGSRLDENIFGSSRANGMLTEQATTPNKASE